MAGVTAAALKLDYDFRYQGAAAKAFKDYTSLTVRLFDASKFKATSPDIDAATLPVKLDVVEIEQKSTGRKHHRVLQISYMNNGATYTTKQTWTIGGKVSPGRALFDTVIGHGAAKAGTGGWTLWLEKVLAASMEPESYAPPPWSGTPSTSLVWTGGGDNSGTAAWKLMSSVIFNVGGGTPAQMGTALTVFMHALRNPNPVWDAQVEKCIGEMKERHKGSPKSAAAAVTALEGGATCLYCVFNELGALDTALTKRASLSDAEMISLCRDFAGCFFGLMCSGFVGVVARHYMRQPIATCVDEMIVLFNMVPLPGAALPQHRVRVDRWNRGPGNDAPSFGHSVESHQLPRNKLSEIRPCDPLTHPGHVMIVDDVTTPKDDKLECTIYESTGDPVAGGLVKCPASVLRMTTPAKALVTRRFYKDKEVDCYRMDHFLCPWNASKKRGFLMLEWGLIQTMIWGGKDGSDTLPQPPFFATP